LAAAARSDMVGLDLAVVMRAFEGGGAQRDMILLCNALASRGVRLAILALRTDGPLRALLDPAVDVVEVPGRQLRYAIPGLRRVIRAIAPAVVVGSEASLNLCLLIAVRSLLRQSRPKVMLREVGSPSVAQYHDPIGRIALPTGCCAAYTAAEREALSSLARRKVSRTASSSPDRSPIRSPG
jgi:hypothetical protein